MLFASDFPSAAARPLFSRLLLRMLPGTVRYTRETVETSIPTGKYFFVTSVALFCLGTSPSLPDAVEKVSCPM